MIKILLLNILKRTKVDFFDCLKKCVTFREALKIIGKCLDSSNLRQCILTELKEAAKQCFINCLN